MWEDKQKIKMTSKETYKVLILWSYGSSSTFTWKWKLIKNNKNVSETQAEETKFLKKCPGVYLIRQNEKLRYAEGGTFLFSKRKNWQLQTRIINPWEQTGQFQALKTCSDTETYENH
jgi:hypothetical protein